MIQRGKSFHDPNTCIRKLITLPILINILDPPRSNLLALECLPKGHILRNA
jgi:hypothetical protein